MKFLIAKKLEMTQEYLEDGTVIPVTVLQAGPVTVTQVKSDEKDGYKAVQVGYGVRKEKNLSKSVLGHIKGLGAFSVLKEFRTEKSDAEFERGQQLNADVFVAGDMVDVTGTSIGRGFAGVVKRHGFKGGKASHGHKDQLRMPGSIGAGEPQKVFKGLKMGGQMGNQQATAKNLQVVAVDAEKNIIKVKGAVPGSNGGIVTIKTAKNA